MCMISRSGLAEKRRSWRGIFVHGEDCWMTYTWRAVAGRRDCTSISEPLSTLFDYGYLRTNRCRSCCTVSRQKGAHVLSIDHAHTPSVQLTRSPAPLATAGPIILCR